MDDSFGTVAEGISMISVTILTKNSRRYLKEVLDALRSFDEVVIYDTGSTDDTLDIAEHFPNVKIYQGPLIGFGPTHNIASHQAKNDWILSIDSDEVPSPEMVQTIHSLELDPRNVYSFPRHNYYKGQWIRGCGWYPDRQIRLYNRLETSFSHDQVHETVLTKNKKHIPLKTALKHYSYDSVTDFLQKMQNYSDLFAIQHAGKKYSSPLKALGHASFAFFKSYILKRGFLEGYAGFLISSYNAHTTLYKYFKLYERNKIN